MYRELVTLFWLNIALLSDGEFFLFHNFDFDFLFSVITVFSKHNYLL